jgi:acyl carrier protein
MLDVTLLPRVAAEMVKVFRCDPSIIGPQTCAADIDGWDSLNNIRMLLLLEEAFSIRFTGMEAASLENVGELVALIDSKLRA